MTITPSLTEYGIGQLPEPCWTITMVDGSEFDLTGCFTPGHYESQTNAEEDIPQYATDERPAFFMKAIPEDFRCTTLILTCGKVFICQGDEDTAHFVDEQDLLHSMQMAEVADLGANRYAEPGCCDTCTAAITAGAQVDKEPHLDQIPAFATPDEYVPTESQGE
jgi:hypothetical protein